MFVPILDSRFLLYLLDQYNKLPLDERDVNYFKDLHPLKLNISQIDISSIDDPKL